MFGASHAYLELLIVIKMPFPMLWRGRCVSKIALKSAPLELSAATARCFLSFRISAWYSKSDIGYCGVGVSIPLWLRLYVFFGKRTFRRSVEF